MGLACRDTADFLWGADIAYVSIWEGGLYGAFVLNVHSRVIVGRRIANGLRTDLVLDALEVATWRRDTSRVALVQRSSAGR